MLSWKIRLLRQTQRETLLANNYKCSKCGGKVMVERSFSTFSKVELSCITCGKYWIVRARYGWACEAIVGRERAFSAGA